MFTITKTCEQQTTPLTTTRLVSQTRAQSRWPASRRDAARRPAGRMLLAAVGAVASQHSYLLVSTPRAASSSFCEALRSSGSGRVRCDQELLNPSALSNISATYPLAPECKQPGSTHRTCVRLSVAPILHHYYGRCPGHTACGFKVFAGHLMDNQYAPESLDQVRAVARELTTVLRSNGVDRVVLLQRRNRTAQYESLVRAFATGDWGFRHAGHVKKDFGQRVSQSRFEATADAWYSAFQEHAGLNVLNVHFEDFIADAKVNYSTVLRTVRFILR